MAVTRYMLRNYWWVVALAAVMLVPRIFIPAADRSYWESDQNFAFVLERLVFILAFGALLFGLSYWFVESLGYRFNRWIKWIHLILSYQFLLSYALLIYIRDCTQKMYLDEIPWEEVSDSILFVLDNKLGRILPSSFILFGFAQIIGVVHLIVALRRGKKQ